MFSNIRRSLEKFDVFPLVLPRISQVPSPSKAHSSDQPAESEEKQIMTEENKAVGLISC